MLDYLDLGALRLHLTDTRGITRAQGLTGSARVRGEALDRLQEDGAVEPGKPLQGARLIVLEGEVFGVNEAAAWSEWEDLSFALDDAIAADALLTWRKAGSLLDLQAFVRLADLSPPILDANNSGPFIAYQATLRAADPRFYSRRTHTVSTTSPVSTAGLTLPLTLPLSFASTGASGGELLVTNAGTAKTWPLIVIDGPVDGPVVQNVNTGELLAFPGLVLAAGDSATIDCQPSRRSVFVNGVDRRDALRWSDGTFFGVAKRSTQTLKFFGLSAGYGDSTRMTVTWRDAYIS